MNMIKMMEMKRMITVCLISAFVTMATYAQTPLKKVYDETINPMRTMANNMAWMLKSLKREECPARERPQGTNFIR